MLHKKILWTLVLILLVSTVFAVPVNHETTSVSRIVGDSANDLAMQLKKSDFGLESAGAFGADGSINNVITKQYGSEGTISNPVLAVTTVKDKLGNNKNNEIILATANPNTKPDWAAYWGVGDVDKWNLNKSNVFIFDAKYAGLYTPKSTSFAGRISPNAPYVAPLSHSSMTFAKAFICNLGKYASIAEDFRQARNKYYITTRSRSEFLGLTLLSYAL